ncbi:IclR family transcriptional regulator [Kocuria marina]|uniref:IclR family transcriptional regulator n=1 Tax=Kocuria marina TaxID=223184 RepID=UPI0022E70F1E|nr:IclR family transcriptional regulator [Kocuria marina]
MSSLERGLAVLMAVTDQGEVSAASLAQQLGVPRSTVYRHLQVLCGYHLVEEDGGLYTPGWRAIGMSGRNLTHTILSKLALDVLMDVSEALEETAVLTVRAGTHAVCLRQVRGPHPEHVSFKINQLLPLYAGAGQRILLAHAPRPVVESLFARTLHTPTGHRLDPHALRVEFEAAFAKGYQLSREELIRGALALAVPVLIRGEAVCSLAVAGQQSRCDRPEWIERAVRVLRKGADRLSERLFVADDDVDPGGAVRNSPLSVNHRQKE